MGIGGTMRSMVERLTQKGILNLEKGKIYVVGEEFNLSAGILKANRKDSTRLTLKPGNRIRITDKDDVPQGRDHYENLNNPEGVPEMVCIAVFNEEHPEVAELFYVLESELKDKRIEVKEAKE